MSAPSALVLGGALALDLSIGEPPNRFHPVVWMGGAARRLVACVPADLELVGGAAIALAVPTGFAMLGHLVEKHLLGGPITLVIRMLLLKPTFAWRALGEAGRRVGRALELGDLDGARTELASLCSRDATHLRAPLLIAASIESLAENASDSFVAPLFYYTLFGLPGALFYRAANTLDAMIGYRGRYERLGKAAARLDDLLNLVPSRMTALLLLGAGALAGADVQHGLRILRRDRHRTASPNAGWPMSVMAGLLRVELTKPGQYRLGQADAPLTPRTLARAWRIVGIGMGIGAAVAAVALLGARRGR